jgi:acetylornithine deacetylase/succinyl-diaminopimelate desuccinylase-like protein
MPDLLSVAHGPNEYVNLSNIEDFALVFPLTATLPRATSN